MSDSEFEPLEWSYDLISVSGDESVHDAFHRLQDATQTWVIIDNSDEGGYFVYQSDALLEQLESFIDPVKDDPEESEPSDEVEEEVDAEAGEGDGDDPSSPTQAFSVSIGTMLNLDTLRPSVVIADKSQASSVAEWPTASVPYVIVTDNQPTAVGVLGEARTGGLRGFMLPDAARDSVPKSIGNTDWSGNTEQESFQDEGVRPLRYPSITVDAPPAPKKKTKYIVDLRRELSSETDEMPLEIKALDDDWEELTLAVHVTSVQVKFEKDEDEVTIRRNKSSIVAEFSGTLRDNVDPGDKIKVLAKFFNGARYCGGTQQTFNQDEIDGADIEQPDVVQDENSGGLEINVAAVQPDATIHISDIGDNRLFWSIRLSSEFRGAPKLPAKLKGESTLGNNPEQEAAVLFDELRDKPDGSHVGPVNGFGSQLWKRTPTFVQLTYWALWDKAQRPLNIQFVTDEPALPWELMRPEREVDDGIDIHPPMALKHNVARWLDDYESYMTPTVEAGRIYTISPKYGSASVRLPRAQEESQMLVDDYGAQSVGGTRASVTSLLHSDPDEQISMLHFAGHGSFDAAKATESSIHLEDGTYTASEVSMPEVRLGRRCHPLVFLNACETGMASSILGQVGGWADAFLSRKFGGFVAPLWAVEDMDAKQVARELVKGIVQDGEQISAVIRSIREKHGKVSPAFYSYLFYGDVTARIV